MLTIGNLTKTYGRQVIFDNVSFMINPGERVGLAGRNGSGKTTLLKLILGEEEPDSGDISIPKNYRISHLSQQIHFTENSVLKEACLNLKPREDGSDETYKAKSILFGLGFAPHELNAHPGILSGGYQVRLNLARILVSEPDLLLLDEPTNYLDIVSVRWLIQFLRNWKNELVIITHDRAFMDAVTTHTMGIHRQKIRKIVGSTEKLYQQILQDEEIYEKTRINDERKKKELEQFINRFRAQASRAKAVQSRIKLLQKKEKREKLYDARDLDFEFKSAPFSGKWLMEVENISFSFSEDSTPLIDRFSMAVKKNDRIGVIGKNGKGKTTFLNLLAGCHLPKKGVIRPNQNLKPGYFGQMNIDRLDPEKTVLDEVLSVHPEHSLGAARNICGSMMFEGDNALKKISVLSGGEKSRVLLGKLLVSPANLILLDEPDNHLDVESVDALVEAIDAYNGAVIFVTHSEMVLNAIATRLVVFDDGKVSLFEGSYGDFLDRIGWEDERAGEAPQPVEGVETKSKVVNRKDMRKDTRRMRAKIITERSRALNPLQKKITGLENKITALERQTEQDNASLIRASQVGEGKAITSLSIAIHEARNNIETLFDELDRVVNEFEEKSRGFEEKLEELEGKV
jgi:ATP-binding cassette subfamily F protein 3